MQGRPLVGRFRTRASHDTVGARGFCGWPPVGFEPLADGTVLMRHSRLEQCFPKRRFESRNGPGAVFIGSSIGRVK